MNITKQQSDALNATVTINIAKADYFEKTEKALSDYRKNANISGFRKGHIPMSIIKNRYGKAVLLNEVNKILQDSLNKYLVDEKINILGNPLPVVNDNFDWNADDFSFDFLLGLVPEFSVDLSAKDVIRYKIVADQELINQEVEQIRERYGKRFSKEQSEEGDELVGTFTNETEGINIRTIISGNFKSKETVNRLENNASINFLTTNSINKLISENKDIASKFIGKKVGDVIVFSAEDPFTNQLIKALQPSDTTYKQNIDIHFIISEINGYQPAEINQEFFDKLFGEGKVTSLEEMEQKIKDDSEIQFTTLSDQLFLDNMIDWLIENTKFDLPVDFLKRWMKETTETPLTDQQIEEEYTKTEKSLRYQLIEQKIITENNLQVAFDEIKTFASDIIKKQMAQFGQMDVSDAEVENIATRVLSNQDEIKRLHDQLTSQKMLHLFTEKSGAKTKEVTHTEFSEIAYQK